MSVSRSKALSWTLLILGGGLFGYSLFGPHMLFAQVAGDGAPPKVSNIQFTVVNATTTIVTWDTDEDADSEVNYGLNKNYGIARDPLPNKKKHRIEIVDLEPSTTYNFRVGSQDYAGNQGLSGNYIFTTKSVINIKDKEKLENIPPEERAVVEQAVTAIRKLKTIDGLKIVAEELQDVAETIIEPPRIIGTPHVEEIGTDFVVISWPTDVDSGTIIRYAREEDYREGADDPYTTEAGDRGERVKEHELRITGLTPATSYHFRAESEGEFNLTGVSRDGTFQTKAALPSIINFRVMKVQEDSAVITWRTNFPAAGTVEYTNMKTKQVKSAGDPVLAASHQLTLPSLALGQRYMAIVKAENAVGDKVTSNPVYFTTVKDIAPPLISKVNNESTLYPSAEAKVQTIVTWATDEPAFCQFWYREGLAPTIEPVGLGEEKDAREDHVQVIVDFLPSTVYQFWVDCRDPSKNSTKSENFVLFTPNKEKSIIDIILENFEGTFGWVKNIGK